MTVSLSGVNLEDPKALRDDMLRRRLPVGAWASKCHSFMSPCEREVGVGHVLIRKSDWDRIADKASMSLVFTDYAGTAITFQKLHPVSDPTPLAQEQRALDPILWVTLEDRRSRYRLVAVNERYNMRSPDGAWEISTINSGTAYTWAQVRDDLWGKLKAVYTDLPSSAPTFPSTPSGTPESLDFEATDAWTALCTLAQAGGLLVKYDPTSDTTTFIDPASSATAEPVTTAQKRTWDTASGVSIAEAVPADVTVSFRRPQRPDRHRVTVAVSESGTTTGAALVLSAYPLAVGEPVSNGTYLTAFAGRVRDFWRRDLAARSEPRSAQYRGVHRWCADAVGYSGYAAWGVSQLAGGEVTTAVSSGPLMRLEYGSEPPADRSGYFIAQLASGTSPYSWKERVESAAGAWADGGRTGTANAYQAQPSAGTPPTPAENDLVLMRLSPTVADVYEFVATGEASCADYPFMHKVVIGVDFVTPKVKYRIRSVDANGCETLSAPVCEDGATCSAVEDFVYYCIDGVCWRVYDGLVPDTYDAGPFASAVLCAAGCPIPPLELTGCCAGQSYTVLYLVLSAGGTVTLTSNGTNFVGSLALTGCTVTFTFDPTNCALSYTAPGAPSVGSTCSGGCVATCGPPFSMGTFRIQSVLLTGSTCSFGNLTGTISE